MHIKLKLNMDSHKPKYYEIDFKKAIHAQNEAVMDNYIVTYKL